MSSALDLLVLNGPLEGEMMQLRPNQPLLLGRSAKGLQLIDPLVSLQHARITWEGDRYWIEDLESATGTFVNDVRLSDKAVVLVPGMRIRLGETDLEVRERPRSAVLRILGAASAILLLVVAVQQFMQSIEVVYNPAVRWYQPIRQGAGYASDILQIPTSFIRETGVDHRELKIEQVTDHDGDGVDELWLVWNRGRRLVTFNPDGSWRTLAELHADCRPKGRSVAEGLPAECIRPEGTVATSVPEICSDRVATTGFPDLDCLGSVYRFRDGAYQVVQHEGLYTWMPPVEREKKSVPNPNGKGSTAVEVTHVVDGPPQPYLFTLVRESNLAGFLAERGVAEPIHYLVCEESLPGIRAQVLTQAGRVVPLSVGCIGQVSVEGATRAADFGTGVPQMFAFTGTGYQALLDDVAVYLSGSTESSFMAADKRKLYEAIATTPTRRPGAIRVAFEGPERIFDPIAAEAPLTADRALLASEFASPPPTRTHVLNLSGPGRYELAGCGEIEVTTGDWHCLYTKGCGEQSAFMRLRNVGCGAPGPVVDVPYGRRLYAYQDPWYQGHVAVESLQQGNQIDVLRVRFAYRERAAETASR